MMGYQVAWIASSRNVAIQQTLKTSCWWHNMCISLLNCMHNIMSTDRSRLLLKVQTLHCQIDCPEVWRASPNHIWHAVADHFRWVNWNSVRMRCTSIRFLDEKQTNNQSEQERNRIIANSIWKEECCLTLSLKKKKKKKSSHFHQVSKRAASIVGNVYCPVKFFDPCL